MVMRIVIASLFLSISQPISSQQAIIDSLQLLLESAPEDTNKILLLGDLSFYSTHLDPQLGLRYAQQTLELSEKLGNKKGITNGLYKIAFAEATLGNYERALEHGHKAMEICESMQDTHRLLFAIDLVGVICTHMGNFNQAIQHLFHAAKLTQAVGDLEHEARIYNNIGELYFQSKDNVNARKYFLKALPLLEQLNNRLFLPTIYLNLGSVTANAAEKKNYLQEAINLSLNENYTKGLAYSYGPMAKYWMDVDSLELSHEYYQKAVDAAEQSGDVYILIDNLIALAQLQIKLNMLEAPQKNLVAALNLATEQRQPNQIQAATELLAKLNYARGNFKTAYQQLLISKQLGDSIFNQDLTNAMARADAQYENSIKERRLIDQELQLTKQRNRIGLIIIIAILSLLIAIGIYQWYLNKQRQEKLTSDLALADERTKSKALQELDQLKSNFFTNISHELRTPLTLIKGPLENILPRAEGTSLYDDVKRAHENSHQLLTLVNEIMELSKLEAKKSTVQESSIKLNETLKRILFSFKSMADLHLISLSYESTVDVDLEIKTDLKKLEKIINNLMANAIKHAPNGNIEMKVAESGSVLQISVYDNGSGIHSADLPHIFDRFYQNLASGCKINWRKWCRSVVGSRICTCTRWRSHSTEQPGIGKHLYLDNSM